MWAILKIDRKQIFLLKKDLEQKLNSNVKIYNPKICVEKYSTNKKKKEIKYNLLGDYIFCFSEKFDSKKTLTYLNYSVLKLTLGKVSCSVFNFNLSFFFFASFLVGKPN